MQNEEKYLQVKEAAELLGVCPNTIRNWGKSGKVDEYRHPLNGYRMFRRSDLETLARKLRTPTKVRMPSKPR